MKNKYQFKVAGMDCAEEVSLIKSVLVPNIVAEQNLGFDLLNGKLIVEAEQSQVAEQDIVQAIKTTGLKAIPWQLYVESGQQTQTFWSRYYRTLLTLISALLLILGFFSHAIIHGFIHALHVDQTSGEAFPIISIAFYLAATVTGGWFVFPKAWSALKRLRPDMNLLMTIAVLGAIAIGQWFEGATVACLFSLALLLESWSVGRARKAIQALMALTPDTARVYSCCSKEFVEKRVEDIRVGDVVMVRPGEKIPLDGQLSSGSTHINQAPITGESMPVEKQVDDEVYAGTINGEGSVEISVTKAAGDTMLANIIQRIEEAQANRASTERWVDSFARYYTPIMICIAIFIALIPPLFLLGDWARWFYEGLVILVIACPCALVISTPVSIIAAISSAARNGVLIKGGMYMEMPARIQAIAFDKTGTLTRGKPEVQQIIPLNNHTENELLTVAAALELNSEHPIAHAICQRAETAGIKPQAAEYFRAVQGKGAEGYINGAQYWLGSHRLLHEKLSGQAVIDAHDAALKLEASGNTVVIIGCDDHACGLIGVADSVRDDSPSAMRQLKKLGVRKLFMLTGDNQGTAQVIANKVGVDGYYSELLPEDKIKHVELLKKEFKHVAMVGDGINDAPAMAASSLGIAMGAIGSDVAIETADIALMTDDVSKLPWLIAHSRRTMRILKQNIAFSILIKAVFLVLAIAGIASLWMAIAADMGASLIVIFNGLRLLMR